MEIEIKIPSVGESITEVTLAQWVKKDGDMVQQDEVICEIESDKASFELNAEQPGVLKTFVKEGDTVAVGTKIASIDTSASAAISETKPKTSVPEAVQAVSSKAGVAEDKVKTQSTEPIRDAYAKGTTSPAAKETLAEQNI